VAQDKPRAGRCVTLSYVAAINGKMCALPAAMEAHYYGMRPTFIGDGMLAGARAFGKERQSYAWTMEILSLLCSYR
jgi:hypothetical protein